MDGSFVARIVATALFGGFGVVLLVVGIRNWRQQRRLLRAPARVLATILASEVKVLETTDSTPGDLRDSSTRSYRPIVRFRYRIDDREYESDLLRPSEIVYDAGSMSGARAEIAPFPPGATVSAFYHPEQPEKAFLLAERSAGPIVFIVLGLLLGPVVWIVGAWVF